MGRGPPTSLSSPPPKEESYTTGENAWEPEEDSGGIEKLNQDVLRAARQLDPKCADSLEKALALSHREKLQSPKKQNTKTKESAKMKEVLKSLKMTWELFRLAQITY